MNLNKAATSTIIGTLVLSLVGSWLYSLITSQTFYSVLRQAAAWVKYIFLAFMTYEVPFWWILSALTALVLLARFLPDTSPPRPAYFDYTTDWFISFKWSWSWVYNSIYNDWEVTNLCAYCPKCDTILPSSGLLDNSITCVRCKTHYNSAYQVVDTPGEVRIMIHDNIRKGVFPKKADE